MAHARARHLAPRAGRSPGRDLLKSTFQIAPKPWILVPWVLVDNQLQTPGTDYSYDASTGVLEFAEGSIPLAGAEIRVEHFCE